MRKPKENAEEEGTEAPFFDDVEAEGFDDSDDDSIDSETGKPKKPARQRVELRNEQHALRRQLSDWDDYGQDDFDTKL